MWCKTLVVTVVGTLAVMVSGAHGQVDTVSTVQIANLNFGAYTGSFYCEDLDNDSLKEIIVCRENKILIFDNNYGLIWGDSSFSSMTRTLFVDMNLDGSKDIILNTSQDIRVFDIYHDSLLWESPRWYGAQYVSFATGHQNVEDDQPDIFLLSRALSSAPYDTVWIECYNGPLFTEYHRCRTQVRNINGPSRDIETPGYLKVGGDSSNRRMFLFVSYVRADEYRPYGYGGESTGYIRIFNAAAFDGLYYQIEIGNSFDPGLAGNVDGTESWFICSWDHWFVNPQGRYGYRTYGKCINYIANDSLRTNSTLYLRNDIDWRSYALGNISDAAPGNEFIYYAPESCLVFSISQHNFIHRFGNSHHVASFFGTVNCPSLFNSPRVLCLTSDTAEAIFIDEYGNYIAILNPIPNGIRKICDVNNNGDDEILAVNGANLMIYRLVDASVGIHDEGIDIPLGLAISVYPNPFNGVVTIEYSLARSSPVEIEIYDIAGRKVGEMLEPDRDAGTYRVQWNASGCSSGIYFCRMRAGERVFSRKMLYLK